MRFWRLDEIWGSRPNAAPLVLSDSLGDSIAGSIADSEEPEAEAEAEEPEAEAEADEVVAVPL